MNLRLQSSFSDNHKNTGHRCVLVVLIDCIIIYIYTNHSKVNLASFFRDPALLPITVPLPPSLLHIAWSLAPKQELPWKKDNSPGDVPQLLRVGKVAGGEASEIKFFELFSPCNLSAQHHGHAQNLQKPALQKRTHSTRRSSTKKCRLQLASWETGIMTTIGRGWKVIKAFPECIAQEELHLYMCICIYIYTYVYS